MADGEAGSAVPLAPIAVAVRELCEFAAKCGDLDRRFTPAPTAQQGIAGHRAVAARRGGGYEREVALEGRVEELLLRGRADGFDASRRRVEEIKTHRGDVTRIPDNHRALHRAQLRVYGALLCRVRGFAAVELALVYYDIDAETETEVVETCSSVELEAFLEGLATKYLDWARAERRHREQRDRAIEALPFPHREFNAGQRSLATAVFRAAADGSARLAQAPTGIGKTLGTLFPALKACARRPIDKLFYLTAKTPGRRVAVEALAQLLPDAGEPPPLRVLELAARDQRCVHPDRQCHGASCPLAAGFYDRLPAARAAAAQAARLDQAGLSAVAAAHSVCPYYLGQEMIRWADVVVGDYNYYFDPHAILFGLATLNEWRATVLVDEAHNLVDRARDMYSATLELAAFIAARRQAPPMLRAPLRRVERALSAVAATALADYFVLDAVPEPLAAALSEFISATGALLGETAEEPPPLLRQAFFDAVAFARLADDFGAHSLVDVTLDGPSLRLCLRNVVPAPFLAPRFAAAQGAVLFSATLNPPDYYRDLLGLPADTPWLDIPTPFAREQLTVRVARHISTCFDAREASLAPIAELVARQYRRAPGNYLAFFSSFDYLDRAVAQMRATQPDVPLWAQAGGMREAEREAFLARFTASGRGVGFAVLGGVFSEGIDLPGDRLIGAFVVTLGLPQINPVNEQMRARMDALFGRGFEYTYLYPGLRKVVQAAGRVIRSRSDRGTVVLVDRRYARSEVRALLPDWWFSP